jgi:PKD repeat protein
VEPLTVRFTDLSGYAPLSWHWNFGDTAESTVRNPVHIYEDAGTYAVSLAATNGNGTNTATKPGFVTVSVCPNQPVSILPTFYPSLQAAYDAASNGSTIRGRFKTLTGNLALNQNILIYLDGGYDCPHDSVVGRTTLKGTLTITHGMAIIENLAIK